MTPTEAGTTWMANTGITGKIFGIFTSQINAVYKGTDEFFSAEEQGFTRETYEV